MAADKIDLNRAEVFALVYLTSEVREGIVRIYPGIHGLYETWNAAEEARKSKTHPTDYHTTRANWRKNAS